MPAKIRLARHGRKRYAYYHIVVADSRAPRDGKFIERIGMYNPNTNPATIELDFDKALTWLQNGAQPSDTARAILSYKGVLIKKHLLEGVKKGAFDEATANSKFKEWLSDKESKIRDKQDRLFNVAEEDSKKRMKAESKVKEDRAEAIAKKHAKLAEAAKQEELAETQEEIVAEVEQPIAQAEEVVTDEVEQPMAQTEEVEVEQPIVQAEEVVAATEIISEEIQEPVVEEVPKQETEESANDEKAAE
ncbi:MAG: 30S ribosomal protein S16 [Bacteroidota bacterium]